MLQRNARSGRKDAAFQEKTDQPRRSRNLHLLQGKLKGIRVSQDQAGTVNAHKPTALRVQLPLVAEMMLITVYDIKAENTPSLS